MSLRPATLRDATLLYTWRQQDEARGHHHGYRQGPTINRAEHNLWLAARLDNPLVRLLIWELQGNPAGVVRIDSNGELAFYGGDPDMLTAAKTFRPFYGNRLKATVDRDDDLRCELLLAAGYTEWPARFFVAR